MTTRYLTNVVLALIGGALLVTSQAFAPTTFAWIMLGGGIAAAAIALPATAIRSRGPAQRVLDAIGSAVGAWTIVASLVFVGAAITWLGFASGAAFVALALAGLTLHELNTERVVHSLAAPAESPMPAEEAPDRLADVR
jgi:hypothetical protein